MTEILEKCYLFSCFDRKSLGSIIKNLDIKITEYKKGEAAIQFGEKYTDIFIVLNGEFRMSQYNEAGKELVMQKAKASYILGLDTAASVKKTSAYNVLCTKDGSLISFGADKIFAQGYLDDNARLHLYERCIQFLANENIRKFHKAEILSIRNPRKKIIKYLSLQSARYGSKEFAVEYSREELASYLDINRSVLSHELKSMERDGIIKVHKNNFILL